MTDSLPAWSGRRVWLTADPRRRRRGTPRQGTHRAGRTLESLREDRACAHRQNCDNSKRTHASVHCVSLLECGSRKRPRCSSLSAQVLLGCCGGNAVYSAAEEKTRKRCCHVR